MRVCCKSDEVETKCATETHPLHMEQSLSHKDCMEGCCLEDEDECDTRSLMRRCFVFSVWDSTYETLNIILNA
eukprot:6456217-Amphidinium_carterae.1